MQDNIILYFIIYSFLGWCLESIYKTILLKTPTNSGFLYGPFCPMYGLGAIMMLALCSFTNNILVLFLIAFIFFSIWEYIVAVILEKLFKTKYWDYSSLKFNFQGRVCLKNSIYWGILGVLLVLVIQPVLRNIVENVPHDVIIFVEIILCFAILVDAIITVYRIMFIDKKIRQVFEISDKIKEKLAELKTETMHAVEQQNVQKLTNKFKNKDNVKEINEIIEDLKTKQAILKIKIYKRIIRLKKAFPEMHSENRAKFMKQKISLEDLKEKIRRYKTK